MYKCIGLHVK